jgi:hypothetical protein
VLRLLSSAVLCFTAFYCAQSFAKPGTTPDASRAERPLIAMPGATLTSSGTAHGLAGRETAGPDTFVLYGGPDHPTEGKFQLADGVTPDWGDGSGLPGRYGGGPDAWTPVDLTHQRVFWHRDTFNGENLNDNGPGNHAMWSGLPAGDPDVAHWFDPPGYGDHWDDSLIYESAPVADPGVGQTVSLEFFLNHELEPDYDFVNVEYERAGVWTEVGRVTGTNSDPPRGSGVFASPGVAFNSFQTAPIEYSGGDYAYNQFLGGGPRIRIRVRVTSDAAFSDANFFPTAAGAAQIDDITVTHLDGTFFEDFEGTGPYLWRPDQQPFFGDFADIYSGITDIDPCRSNNTPVVGFVDYGQTVRNGPGVSGAVSTGGTTHPGINYGISGNWVTNHDGGLDGVEYLTNEIRSPVIQLDLPGSADDGPEFSGFKIRVDVWEHLPSTGSVFYSWAVQSARPGDPFSESWTEGGLVFGSGAAKWTSRQLDLSGLILDNADRIQVALRVVDAGATIDPYPYESTPAPVFDNVTVYKYRLAGPVFSVQTASLAQDGFPVGGAIDTSTPTNRDRLDVPFSMSRDRNDQGMMNVPGDSVTIDVYPIIPGTEITDVRMVWALSTNPLFEGALRSAPGRSQDEGVVAGPAGTVWSGAVIASKALYYPYYLFRWSADLPDVDFMYPGDVLHYHFEATDSDGRVSTIPYDVSALGDYGPGSTYDPRFVVRALPSLRDVAGNQPALLVIDESGHDGDAPEIRSSLQQLGYGEGADYDTYTVRAPGSTLGNGIGSAGAHGATASQLGGYEHIIYLAGDLPHGLLSDGLSQFDKGDDITTLEDWHALPGARNVAYFGDYIATYHEERSVATAIYLGNTMGVDWIGEDVGSAIGGQTAPVILPNPASSFDFMVPWVAYGGCDAIKEFDQIQPLTGASAGHYFTDAGGVTITDPSAGVASVIHSTAGGVEATFPFSLSAMHGVANRAVGLSARTELIAEVLALFSAAPGGGPPVAAPQVHRVALSVAPNPFNPVTVVKFTALPGSKGSVKVFNLRGELVRTLHRGEFQTQEFRWDGVDEHGASVASGVYVVQAEVGGETQSAKLALVK